jgi:hypothetical protein
MAVVYVDNQERAAVGRRCPDRNAVQRRRHVLATVGANQYVEPFEPGRGKPRQRDDRAGGSARAVPSLQREQRF